MLLFCFCSVLKFSETRSSWIEIDEVSVSGRQSRLKVDGAISGEPPAWTDIQIWSEKVVHHRLVTTSFSTSSTSTPLIRLELGGETSFDMLSLICVTNLLATSI